MALLIASFSILTSSVYSRIVSKVLRGHISSKMDILSPLKDR